MHNRYRAVFYEADTGGWIGYVAEVPGANVQADTLEQARAQLRDAVRLVNEANLQVLNTRLPLRRLVWEDLDVELTS